MGFVVVQNGREQDGYSNSEMLQQQILNVSRKKGELQQLEIELRAQMIARHEIMEIQSNYESQFTEYANAAARMQVRFHPPGILAGFFYLFISSSIVLRGS